MKITFLILLSFSITCIFGQVTPPDTVFVKRTLSEKGYEVDTLYIPGGVSVDQVLTGTQFIPYSDKMVGLLNNGLSAVSFSILKHCNGEIKEYKNPRVIKAFRANDLLTIDVEVASNCCHNFLGEAEVLKGDTLNLIYIGYGGFCGCTCYYTVRFVFDTTLEKEYRILQKVMVNGKSSTVSGIAKE